MQIQAVRPSATTLSTGPSVPAVFWLTQCLAYCRWSVKNECMLQSHVPVLSSLPTDKETLDRGLLLSSPKLAKASQGVWLRE